MIRNRVAPGYCENDVIQDDGGPADTSVFAGEDYVVLSGVAKEDPYYAAAEQLAAHHKTKHIVRFDPSNPGGVLDALRQLAPRNVAIVVRPEQIHVNTVRAFLKMSTKLDDDPFVDFAFGYITGATAEDAVQFVRNIVAASKSKRHPRKVGNAAVWGSELPCEASDGRYRAGKLDFPQRSLRFTAPDGKQGRNQEFINEELPSLEGCGAIIMGGHGMPWEIVTGPRAEDIANLNLFPAVGFNYACHTGVTLRYPEHRWQGDSYFDELLDVDRDRSFALRMIAAGVTGYVAYVNPRPAGPELSIDFQRVLAGASLGSVRRNDYAKIVLGYVGFGESGITVADVGENAKIPRDQLNSVRHLMLDAATGGILYGDPAFSPYPEQKDALPLRTTVKRIEETMAVEMCVDAEWLFVWCADPFRWFDHKAGKMAMKVYDRIELPKQFDSVTHVEIASATVGGTDLELLPPVWAVEDDRGRRYLHLKAGFGRVQAIGDLKVCFLIR